VRVVCVGRHDTVGLPASKLACDAILAELKGQCRWRLSELFQIAAKAGVLVAGERVSARSVMVSALMDFAMGSCGGWRRLSSARSLRNREVPLALLEVKKSKI
jgi:hypothetical protein